METKPYEIFLVIYKPKEDAKSGHINGGSPDGSYWGQSFTSNPAKVYNYLNDKELDVRVFRLPDMSEVDSVSIGVEYTKPLV
jgi:hypothetical protein